VAYTHSKYEVEMIPYNPTVLVTGKANGVNLAVTTPAARWGPGMVPHIIRGAAIIPLVTTALTGGAVECSFESDISVAGTPTKLFGIGLPSAGAIHKSVYFTPTRIIEIKPGQIVDFRCTTAATAGVLAKVMLYVEPRWEDPSNVTSMQATT